MRWTKRGLIHAADGRRAWQQSHGFPPTPVMRDDGTLRLYLAFCDAQTVGRIGWVDVDPENPSRVLGVSDEPVLDVGAPGAFDENGLLPTCVIPVGDELWMYYVGYQLGQQLTYYQFQGLAISTDGGDSFHRAQRVPIIDRSDTELVNRTSAFVRAAVQGGFEMWYVGGSEWTVVDGKPLPVYNMRHIWSADGVHWPTEGTVCLDFSIDDEHAFGRPWVFQRDGVERMFYSVRTRSKDYRIGVAERREDVWVRTDASVGIDVSDSGWDSESIAYASVIELGEEIVMFYNGNRRGATGFGYAVLESAWA